MKSNTRSANLLRLSASLARLGLTADETLALLRIERTLSNWSTAECNGEIERDEMTGKPVAVSRGYTQGTGKRVTWSIADRETGALKRLAAILAPHKRRALAYIQGDPRGCALYIVPRKALRSRGFKPVRVPGGWSIARKGGVPYTVTPRSLARARAFAQHETLSSLYSSFGIAVCV